MIWKTCGHCGGAGVIEEGQASAHMLGLVLMMAVVGSCWFAIGIAVGKYVTFGG
jgi:hypothetical protein